CAFTDTTHSDFYTLSLHDALPILLWHYGQPIADVSIIPTDAAGRAARDHVTVVLNGDGGDEAFGGYARPIVARAAEALRGALPADRKSTRLNSSHLGISYAVFCLK